MFNYHHLFNLMTCIRTNLEILLFSNCTLLIFTYLFQILSSMMQISQTCNLNSFFYSLSPLLLKSKLKKTLFSKKGTAI